MQEAKQGVFYLVDQDPFLVRKIAQIATKLPAIVRFRRINPTDFFKWLDGELDGEEFSNQDAILFVDREIDGYDGYALGSFMALRKDNLGILQEIPRFLLYEKKNSWQRSSAFAIGFHDVFNWPDSEDVIRNKLESTIKYLRQNRELAEANNTLVSERKLTEGLLAFMRERSPIAKSNFRIFQKTGENGLVSGDGVFSAFNSHRQVQHILLVDFMGHSISAAIQYPIVAELFNELTRDNIPMIGILIAIHQRMLMVNTHLEHHKQDHRLNLPIIAAEINFINKELNLWNYNQPCCVIMELNNTETKLELHGTIGGSHLGLGIREGNEPKTSTNPEGALLSVPSPELLADFAPTLTETFKSTWRLFVCTDGLVQKKVTEECELLGKILSEKQYLPPPDESYLSSIVSELWTQLNRVQSPKGPEDDVSLIEIHFSDGYPTSQS